MKMLPFTLLILQIMFATSSVSSVSDGPRNGYDEKNYHISANKLQWSSAQQSCKSLFGSNSSIVSVQTKEEWDYLKSILEPHEIVQTYWTAGMYDRNSNVWRWPDNSILTSWAPWDNNYPSVNPSALHRVIIAHANRTTASWRTVPNTQSHRFICELPYSSPIPIVCSDMDLVIVLDSSASIGSHNYKKARNFAVKLVAEFTQTYNASRIAFLIYSDTVNVVIDLENTLTPDEIDSAIMDAPYLKGRTDTHVGIKRAIQLQSSPREGDENVTKNIVVITEGESSDSILTAAAVEAAKDMGIRTFSVGITPSADEDDLLLIGGGDSDYVFTTDECDKLIVLVEPLTRKMCQDDNY